MHGRLAKLAALTGMALLATAAPAYALDTKVKSFDGTKIVTHFSPAPGLEKGEKAPTIMVGHGWGGTGDSSAGDPFLERGYNVLTWDARGFGGSGGTVMIDHPRFEARDVSALIDFIAKRPRAQLDGPGDPRVGMSGPSYGGGIQLISAATDRRIDAITPTIPWHNLLESLYPHDSVKVGWDLALIGVGIPTSLLPGIFEPDGIETGNQSEQFYRSVIGGTTTGQIPTAEQAWFQKHGPDFLLKRIKAPTMIVQGSVDTLFDLTQGHRNYMALKDNGIPLKMMWFCGGHGICNVDSDGAGGAIPLDSPRVQKRRLAWFDRYLRDRKVRTGPAFEWIDQTGDWHTSSGYPLKHKGRLTGNLGSATVPLVPGINPTSGILIVASPDPLAPVKVPIPAEGGEEIVGAPTLTFDYSSLGIQTTRPDGDTHVFGQIVDKERNVVVGNQATPIPIELNEGKDRVRVQLTRIANVAPEQGFELQIIGQSNLFDAQRAAGALQIENLEVRLPKTEGR